MNDLRGGDDKNSIKTVELSYKFEFSASKQLLEMVGRMQELVPGAGLSELFEKAVTAYLKTHCPKERQKRREQKKQNLSAKAKDELPVATDKPIKANSNSRYIPISLRDAVAKRDGYQCTFKTKDGKRCNCKVALQNEHCFSFALGGEHSFENLRLLCPAHNRLMAEKTYGRQFMNKYYSKRSGDKKLL